VATITNMQQQYGVDKTYEINVNEAPIMQVSPLNLVFTAVQGGVNPPSQVVNIINKGGGTLKWVAVTDASWLKFSPSSGIAPSTMSVFVDITGLPAGNYVGYINIDGSHPRSLCCAEPCSATVMVNLQVIPPTPTPSASFLRPPGMASLIPVSAKGVSAWLSEIRHSLSAMGVSGLLSPEPVEFVILLELKMELASP
jgi:hypothetical protein